MSQHVLLFHLGPIQDFIARRGVPAISGSAAMCSAR